jgi:hypothetical protein
MVEFIRRMFRWRVPVEWTPGTTFVYEFRCGWCGETKHVESPFPKEIWWHQCTVAHTTRATKE